MIHKYILKTHTDGGALCKPGTQKYVQAFIHTDDNINTVMLRCWRWFAATSELSQTNVCVLHWCFRGAMWDTSLSEIKQTCCLSAVSSRSLTLAVGAVGLCREQITLYTESEQLSSMTDAVIKSICCLWPAGEEHGFIAHVWDQLTKSNSDYQCATQLVILSFFPGGGASAVRRSLDPSHPQKSILRGNRVEKFLLRFKIRCQVHMKLLIKTRCVFKVQLCSFHQQFFN